MDFGDVLPVHLGYLKVKNTYEVAKHYECVQNHKRALNAIFKTITKANINLNRN